MTIPDPNNLLFDAPEAAGFAEVGAGRTIECDVVIVGTGPGGASVGRESRALAPHQGGRGRDWVRARA